MSLDEICIAISSFSFGGVVGMVLCDWINNKFKV